MKRKLSDHIKLISLTAILMVYTLGLIHAQTGKLNFAGTWVFNAEKSTLPQNGGGNQRMGGGNIVVTQEPNLLTRSRTGQNGTTRITKYTLDGKECVNTTPRGESKSTANWSGDGKTLTIISKVNFEGKDRTITETWSLADPKTLSIVTTRQDQGGEIKATMVFDKK